MIKMEIDPSVVVATIINLIILILILKHFFFERLQKMLEERESYIGSQISQAEQDSLKARDYMQENEKILGEAKSKGNTIVEHKKEQANKLYDEIVKDASKESKLIVDRANLEIKRQVEKAQYEIKKQVVDLAIDLSAKAIQEKIQDEKQTELINDFITKVGS